MLIFMYYFADAASMHTDEQFNYDMNSINANCLTDAFGQTNGWKRQQHAMLNAGNQNKGECFGQNPSTVKLQHKTINL